MSRHRLFLLACLSLSLLTRVSAEIPLPPSTFYGRIDSVGGLTATVTREGQRVLTSRADFREHEGETYFVLEVPLETAIGAPGPSGLAAREGDVLESLELDGAVIATPRIQLVQAMGQELTLIQAGAFIRGDADANGSLNITDPILTLQWLFIAGASPSCQDAADTDDNGSIEITDAVHLLSFLYRGGPPPRPPFDGCGSDATVDGLGCNRYASCPSAGGGAGGGGESLGGGGGVAGGVGGAAEGPRLAAQIDPPAVALRSRPEAVALWHPAGTEHEAMARRTSQSEDAVSRLGPIAIAPAVVRWGAASDSGREKSFTVLNLRPVGLSLRLRSLSRAFSVRPKQVRVPSEGAMAAFVTLEDVELAADVSGEPAVAIEMEDADGDEVARIRLEVESLVSPIGVLEIGNATVPASGAEPLSVPMWLDANVPLEKVDLAIGISAGAFDSATFLPEPGLYWKKSESHGGGELRGVLTLLPGMIGRKDVGRLVLEPREPLSPSTYPILVTKAIGGDSEDKEMDLDRAHGQALVLAEALDADLLDTVLDLLRHLFQGGVEPRLLEAIDFGPDGIASMDDAVRELDRAFKR